MKNRWLWAATLILVAAATTFSATRINLATQVRGTLGETNGGTAQNTYALGDTLYSDAADSLAKLSGNITTTKKFLTQTGTGAVSAAPSWGDVLDADIPATIARDSELHAQSHVLDGADHTVSGLTIGNYVRALTATTFGFAAILDADLPASIARDSELHNQSHVIATTAGLGADHTTSGLTARQVLIATGATTALFRALVDADVPNSITLSNITQITTRNFTAMQGSVTDAQVPNTITLNNLTQITTRNFSAMQGSVTDAQVPNTISLTNLTQIATRNHSSLQGIVATDHHAQRVQIWRSGFIEASPATGLTVLPLPVSDQCAVGISVQRVTVVAISKGSGTMTFQVTRFNNAGVSQGNIFSGNQTYSNTGNNRQDYTANTTTATSNDYFRFNLVTVNSQADVTFVVEGKCNVL